MAPAPLAEERISIEKKDVRQGISAAGDMEAGQAEEQEKTYYSKLSVWLMVLFSGLAIGSDG